ncbi:MAG: hypothetical protein KGQ82_02880 [Alphaproteobacteria bacterium]|nr:hypothetical protein [Alphaproteobacteria bacterium]
MAQLLWPICGWHREKRFIGRACRKATATVSIGAVAGGLGRGDVIYVRPIWRLVMAVIRAILEPVFKRLQI